MAKATRQESQGFTPVPHEILEMLARTELSSYQLRVLMVILRRTFGWHKDADTIASLQFRSATGINDRRNIHRTVKSLADRRIIVVYRDDKHAGNYRINRNLAEWKLSSVKTTRVQRRKLEKGVISIDDTPSSMETAQPLSVETTRPPSVETTSEDTGKQIKEIKDNARSRADSLFSDSRNEDSDKNSGGKKARSAMAEYLDWKAQNNNHDMPFQKWLSTYG